MDHPDTFSRKRAWWSSWRNLVAQSILLLLAVLSLFPNTLPRAQARRVVVSAYSISGTVFDDYTQDGTQGTNEPGINGIIVTAYNAAGAVVTSATTATIATVLGQYTLSIPAGVGPVRLLFRNFGPTSTIADLTGLYPGIHTGGTTVQFVSGASATNTVNLGLARPAEYCQFRPNLATSCYVSGDQNTAGQHVVVSFATSGGSTPTINPLANSTDVGSTWGLAYRRSSKSLFAAAYFKRHTGFKPGGSTGAIYLISNANTALPGTPTLFTDLNTAVGAGTAGADAHDTSNYALDASAYDQVGKVSLGGMALSDDETTLYVMNLADKKLYSIAVGTAPALPVAGAINSTAVPVPASCTSSDFRPFAVTSYHGLIYVGAVCSAESTVTGGLPLGDPTQLRAYVFVYTPGSGFTTNPIFQFPLNYTRHCSVDSSFANCTASGSSNLNVGMPATWNPWHPGYIAYQDLGNNPGQKAITYPQPMLSSIAFDRGDLIIGLRDRYGDQTGNNALIPDGSKLLSGTTAGDTLRACLNTAGNFTSGWTLESNGTCGGVTTAGANDGEGPGGGQFYYQNNWYPPHDYLATGSVLQPPQSSYMISSLLNPLQVGYTGGIRTSSNFTGSQIANYLVYGAAAGNLGKANGLGSLAPFCQAAPIEIGNRIWDDINLNGIQDPGEVGIAGVTVHLYQANGTTLVSTTTTDATGAYAFTIQPYTNYVIKLDNAADFASGGVVQQYRLTSANQDTSTHLFDSKALNTSPLIPIGAGNYPSISIATHLPGQNDHSFDIGLIPPPDLSLIKTVA